MSVEKLSAPEVIKMVETGRINGMSVEWLKEAKTVLDKSREAIIQSSFMEEVIPEDDLREWMPQIQNAQETIQNKLNSAGAKP